MHELPLLRMGIILTAIDEKHIKLSARMQMKAQVLHIYIQEYYESHEKEKPPQCICTFPKQDYPEEEYVLLFFSAVGLNSKRSALPIFNNHNSEHILYLFFNEIKRTRFPFLQL